MSKRFSRFKPGGAKQTHLLLAAMLWTLIGSLLFVRGISIAVDLQCLWVIAPASVLASLKSRFILDRAARKGVERISRFADGTCLGAVYSVKTWLLVFVMMSFGVFLRSSPLPPWLLALVTMTIGMALFWSSRHAWSAWRYNKYPFNHVDS